MHTNKLTHSVILIGYSGHAFVVCDSLLKSGFSVAGYCDISRQTENPYHLSYFGSENTPEGLLKFNSHHFFIAIGDNYTRQKVATKMESHRFYLSVNAIHPNSSLGHHIHLGKGIFIAANATINSLAFIGNGTICNTGSIIEHECIIGDFAHIAPGAVLAGNVKVGSRSFIGANSVVKQGINIGKDVIVGAGSVVIKDIPDNVTVVGNPAKTIKNN